MRVNSKGGLAIGCGVGGSEGRGSCHTSSSVPSNKSGWKGKAV